ncbi:MAG: hypothetical protein GSR80_001000 [Desulfurococcales archaeon]|nr:hypothetical protein [Desulfurococcales archaeon]
MAAGILSEVAENLSRIVSSLSVRRSTSGRRKKELLAEYIKSMAGLYEEHAYLPQVYPVFAVNFSYHQPRVWREIARSLEGLNTALQEALQARGVLGRVEPGTPQGFIVLTLVASALLCVEAARGYKPEARFRMGGVTVGTAGYCSIMRHAHRTSLLLGSHKFVDYALEFVNEAIQDFVAKTTSKKCSGCKDKAGPIGSLRSLWAFRGECPVCYDAFRAEFTSRILTAYRGYLASLYAFRWMYSSAVLYGHETKGVIMPELRGVRANYPALATYLGRLIAQAIEVWSGRIPDYSAFEGLAQVIVEYLDLYTSFRAEASRLQGSGRVESVYRLDSVSRWHANVQGIIRDNPALSLIVPTGLGDVVDDLVNYAVNERVHAIAAANYAPEAWGAFQWFSAVDLESLITKRILRAGAGQ